MEHKKADKPTSQSTRLALRAAALASVMLIAATALADKPRIQWDTSYDFSSVGTFQWREPPEASLSDSDPFLHSRIVNAIEFELTQYGLTEVTSNPDVYVTYHASTETDVSLRSDSIGYGFGGYGLGGWGYYGYGRMGPITTSVNTRVVEIERGTLVVDVWDAGTNQLIWRGSAADITISDNPETTQKNTVKAIEKMAKQYRKLRARES